MVNIDTKKAIHNALLQSEGWISGELISSHLCISRVAVWKHLQKMKEAGYPLLSSGSGYKLSPDEDTLAPWALDLHGREVHHFAQTESTMEEARRLAEEGVSPGTLILAETQTEGRDRFGKKWESSPGGLYLTLIEYPEAPLTAVHKFNTNALRAIQNYLKEAFSLDTSCTPPDGLWVNEKKIAGVLLEVSGEIERIRYLCIGIGIHVKNLSLGEKSISIEKLTGKKMKRREIIHDFLSYYESYQKSYLKD